VRYPAADGDAAFLAHLVARVQGAGAELRPTATSVAVRTLDGRPVGDVLGVPLHSDVRCYAAQLRAHLIATSPPTARRRTAPSETQEPIERGGLTLLPSTP
jgi:hypothetical protein